MRKATLGIFTDTGVKVIGTFTNDTEFKRLLLRKGRARSLCDDCGVETCPVAPIAMRDEVWMPGACEAYMVHDRLWPRGCKFLCIGCRSPAWP